MFNVPGYENPHSRFNITSKKLISVFVSEYFRWRLTKENLSEDEKMHRLKRLNLLIKRKVKTVDFKLNQEIANQTLRMETEEVGENFVEVKEEP